MVVIEPLKSGKFLVRDPLPGSESKGRTLEQIEADTHLVPAPANIVASRHDRALNETVSNAVAPRDPR
jgi:hypothetical protein